MLSWVLLLFFTSTNFAQDKINKNFDGIQEIQINIGSGDLTVDKSNNNSVTIEVEYNANHMEPLFNQKGNKLVLEEKHHKKNNRDESRYTLRIPDEMVIKTNIGAGKSAYNGVYIKLDHNTGAGKIGFTNVSGNLKVNSGVGDISLSQSEGNFNLNSGTGSLKLENVSGSFALNSGTGNVKVDYGHITGNSTLNSGTGNVELVVAKGLTGELSLNSGTGNATLNFNGQPIAGDFEMQCSEKHGKISAPFNFDHTETIDKGGNNSATLKKSAKIGSGQPKIQVSTGTGTAAVKK